MLENKSICLVKMSKSTGNTSADNLKASPEIPAEKPVNNNIKERLNLHVKRRLQESAADAFLLNNNSTDNYNELKVRKQYTKRTEKPNTTTIGRRAKRIKLKQVAGACTVSNRDTESVGSVASTSTTASAGDDDGSRDDNSQNTDLHSPKEKEKCPDLLNVVLNVKKRALFRNPEVVKFLQNMMDVLRQ